MNKQELIDYCNAIKENKSQVINCIDVNGIIKKIEQLDEPQKPVVKQVVAEWYEENKNNLDKNIYDCIVGWGIHSKEIRDWMRETSPFQTLVNMHQFGYTVEKEKRYLVKMKGVNDYGCYLNKDLLSKKYFLESKAEICGCRTKHTRKQLEDDDFGWVFDCPGIDIEEVE